MFTIKNAGVVAVVGVCALAAVLLSGCTGARFKGEKTARVELPSPPAGTTGRAAPPVAHSVALGAPVREAPSVSAFVDLESALETSPESAGEVEVRTRVLPADATPASGDAGLLRGDVAISGRGAAFRGRPVVRVTSQRGWISVKAGPVGSVNVAGHVRATTPERYEAAEVVAVQEADGSVTVRMDWPGTANMGETAGLEVTVPAEADVEVRTPEGRLSVAGLRGELFLRTGDGAIEVTGHRGPVRAETGGGRVDVVDVTGPVVVRSGGGEVTVVLAPEDGASSSGTWQGAGADGDAKPRAAAGMVDIDTSSGTVRLTLTRDFGGELELRTGSGVVDVRDLPAARIISTGQRHMHLAIGEGGGKSRAVTARGNVVVRVGK